MTCLNNEILKKSKLIHKTHVSSLEKILLSEYLYDSGTLYNKQLELEGGEGGSGKRKCCNTYDYKSYDEIPEGCYESCGVYFRLFLKHVFMTKPTSDYCMLEFSKKLLCDSDYKWHLNTCENNGFISYNNRAPYGDDCTAEKTYFRNNINNFTLEEYNPNQLELVINKSVPISFLKKVYFFSEKHYLSFYKQLNSLNIIPVLIQ